MPDYPQKNTKTCWERKGGCEGLDLSRGADWLLELQDWWRWKTGVLMDSAVKEPCKNSEVIQWGKGIYMWSCPEAANSRVIWGALIRVWKKIHEDKDLESFEKTICCEDTGTEKRRKRSSVIAKMEDLAEGLRLKVGWCAWPSRTLPRWTPAWEQGMRSKGWEEQKG